MPGGIQTRPHVSSHAIVRYCQRVLDVHPLVRGDFTEAELARIHVTMAGRSHIEIVSEILTPAVRTAIEAGFTTFGTGRFVIEASSTGTIKTILPPFPRPHGKLQIMDREEMREKLRRKQRRDRHARGSA